MATGIVSTGSHIHNFPNVSEVLFWINNVAFVLLLIFFFGRVIFYFDDFKTDLTSHAKGAGFLTITAASCLLGTGYVQAEQRDTIATLLLYFGFAMWIILIFAFFSSVIVKEEKPSPETGLNGSLFLVVVSTQSIAILIVKLLGDVLTPGQGVLFLALCMLLLGAMLYLIIAPLITYRLLFYPVTAQEVMPTYWINSGAASITALAAITLSKSLEENNSLNAFHPIMQLISVMFWSIASFWLVLILILELWRYLIKHSPLSYTPEFCSLVFPIGMYTVCTFELGQAFDLHLLRSISKIFLFIAWAAWGATFIGLFFHVAKKLKAE